MAARSGPTGTSNMSKLGDFPPVRIPLKRPGNDVDIAGIVLYLAVSARAYVNGGTVAVD